MYDNLSYVNLFECRIADRAFQSLLLRFRITSNIVGGYRLEQFYRLEGFVQIFLKGLNDRKCFSSGVKKRFCTLVFMLRAKKGVTPDCIAGTSWFNTIRRLLSGNKIWEIYPSVCLVDRGVYWIYGI